MGDQAEPEDRPAGPPAALGERASSPTPIDEMSVATLSRYIRLTRSRLRDVERRLEKCETDRQTLRNISGSTKRDIAQLAERRQLALDEFSRMSDPREELSDDHWARLDLIRRIDEFMPRLRQADKDSQRSLAENKLSGDMLRRHRTELNYQLTLLNARRNALTDSSDQTPDDVGDLHAARARRRLLWLLSSSTHSRAELSLERVSSWLRDYLLGARGDSYRISSSSGDLEIAGFYRDIVNLESDQSELRIDMLVAVLRVIAESRPDLLRVVVSEVVDLIDTPERGGERVNTVILELLQHLDARVAAERSDTAPPIEASE